MCTETPLTCAPHRQCREANANNGLYRIETRCLRGTLTFLSTFHNRRSNNLLLSGEHLLEAEHGETEENTHDAASENVSGSAENVGTISLLVTGDVGDLLNISSMGNTLETEGSDSTTHGHGLRKVLESWLLAVLSLDTRDEGPGRASDRPADANCTITTHLSHVSATSQPRRPSA